MSELEASHRERPLVTTELRIPVLMYHRVGTAHNAWESKYCVSPEIFRHQMQRLQRAGYSAVSIEKFVAWLENGESLPPRAFVLTFDDGFKGVYDFAYPVLRQLAWPATVFLVADLIGQEDLWCRSSNPSGATYPLMDEDQIKEMRESGFSFHSHSRSHASLRTLDDRQLMDEISGSRASLQQLLQSSIDFFAYPFGHLDQRVIDETMKAGYRAAFCTQPGFNRRNVDRFRIRRLDIFGTDSPAMVLRKIRLGTNDGSALQTILYYVSRTFARFRH